MTQEDKDLLLKDLCARLPYGVKGQYIESEDELLRAVIINYHSLHPKSHPTSEGMVMCGHLKPWLFPLSSMTEKQLYEVSQIIGKDVAIFTDYLLTIDHRRRTFSYQELDALFDWLNKNHFDYRGLIPMGLAIDATGKNIY